MQRMIIATEHLVVVALVVDKDSTLMYVCALKIQNTEPRFVTA
jgi:hypothetical protein